MSEFPTYTDPPIPITAEAQRYAEKLHQRIQALVGNTALPYDHDEPSPEEGEGHFIHRGPLDAGEAERLVADAASLAIKRLTLSGERMALALLGDFASETPQHKAAATGAAAKAIQEREKRKATPLEIDTLTTALREQARLLLQRVEARNATFQLPEVITGESLAKAAFEFCTCNGEGHYLDLELAKLAESGGASGKAVAESLRRKAKKRLGRVLKRIEGKQARGGRPFVQDLLELWDPFKGPPDVEASTFSVPPLPALVTLGMALWEDGVRARCEEMAQRGERPLAAPLVILSDLTQNPKKLRVGDGGTLWGDTGKLALSVKAPSMNLAAAEMAIRGGLDVTAFWQLLGYLLERQHEQFTLTGSAGAAASIDVGTISELTTACGLSKSKVDAIRIALEVGNKLGADRAGESWRGLWTIGGDLGKSNRGQLRITLGPVLHVDAAAFMPKTSKLLAPVASPSMMPKPVGYRPTYARQYAADQAIACVLARRSIHGVAEDDSFVVPFDCDGDRRDIATLTGLRLDQSARWLDRLIYPSQVRPLPEPVGLCQVLERADSKHLRVLNPGWVALLTDQHKRRKRNSARGKKSARKRQAGR